MIPQTYPSTLSANNQRQMVVFVLSDVSGLTRWIDYIPVKPPIEGTSPSLANTYDNNGYILVEKLDSIVGKQAWIDYIPVFIDDSATISWSTNILGYIPMDVTQDFILNNLELEDGDNLLLETGYYILLEQ